VSSAETRFDGSFDVDYEFPAVSTARNTDIDPFEYHYCDTCEVGEEVIVFGAGFEPNTKVPLGFYLDSGFNDKGDWLLELERSVVVETNSQGRFSTSLVVEPSDPSGTYEVIAVENPEQDTDKAWEVNTGCYQIP
jgi:hypothetical protein